MDMTQSVVSKRSFLKRALSKQVKEAGNWVNVLESRATNNAEDIAFSFLSDGEVVTRKITYLELSLRVKALAVDLLKHACPGDRAILLMPNGIDYIIGLFACFYSGIIAVTAYPPLHKKRDWKRINSMLSDSAPSVLLSDSKLLEKVHIWQQENAPRCHLAEVGKEDLSLTDNWQMPVINTESIAYLQYSSGSTGDPKGVMLSHKNLLHNVCLSCQFYNVSDKDSLVSWLPMYHDMGLIGSILNPIYSGNKAWLIPPAVILQKPFLWLKAISDFKATVSAGPNFIFEHCVNRVSDTQKHTIDLSSWRCAINGAEPIKVKTLSDFTKAFAVSGLSDTVLSPSYGMAESSLFIAGTPTNEQPISLKADREDYKNSKIQINDSGISIASSGVLNNAMDVKIVNTKISQALPDDTVGEILVKGDSVARGYWNKKELSNTTFNNYVNGEGGYLNTGDLGFIHDNNLYICGRNKEVIIVNGRNHFPQDIEATIQSVDTALTDHGGAVFSVNANEDGEQQIIAVQELSRAAAKQKDHQALIEQLRQAVAEVHEINLTTVILVAPMTLNKTTSGKIQRFLSKEKFINDELKIIDQWHKPQITSRYDLNQGITLVATKKLPSLRANEPKLIEAWIITWVSQQLEIDPNKLKPGQELINLGLDSVDAMMLINELATQLNVNIDPEQIWQYPSIKDISLYLSSLDKKEQSSESMLEGEI